MFKIDFIVTESIILRDFLNQKIPKKTLTDIKNAGKILVNGHEKTVRTIVNKDDVVTTYYPLETVDMEKSYKPLNIIFEDEYLLVLNKEPNQVCIPVRHYEKNTLANDILGYYEQNNINATVHFVNRLDKDTSGLLIVAKNRYVHNLFSQNLKEYITRKYLAIACGIIDNDNYEIVANIKKDGNSIRRIIATDGDYAKTYVKVLKRFKEYTLIECTLETGRTHQIRVHLNYLQHPLLFDEIYGNNIDEKNRLALHSYYLKFYHPLQDKYYEFEIDLPNDMKRLID